MSVLHWLDFGIGAVLNSATGTQTTTIDGIGVSVTGNEVSTDSLVIVRDFPIYTAPTEAFDPTSTLKIYSGNIDSNTPGPSFTAGTLDINFGDSTDPFDPVAAGLTFRVGALGGNGIVSEENVIVQAFDKYGNEVPVTATPGSSVTVNAPADQYIGGSGITYSTSESGSILFEVPGPVARISITYNNSQEPTNGQFVTVSDLHFNVVDPVVDQPRFPSEAVDLYPLDDLDSVDGTTGNDSISTGDDADTINGGAGDDTLDGGWDNDLISGGGGNDSIIGGRGSDTIDGGTGGDTIDAGGNPLTDYYSDYEALTGPSTADDPKLPIEGFYSDPNPDDDRDFVLGRGGADSIITGDDSDTIHGGDDNDTIDGGIDADSIFGENGADSIIGGHGADTIDGGFGDDFIQASGSTLLYANEVDATDPIPENDRDFVLGGGGNDTILGGDDDDTLDGGTGADLIYGGIDEDEIHGGTDNDTLYGEQGADTIYGDRGDDTIYGGIGADSMFGGDDSDYFRYLDDGDVIDGNEGGVDFDQIDLRPIDVPGTQLIPGVDILIADPNVVGGTIFINYDTGNFENGTITYFDPGFTATDVIQFSNIENIIIPCFTPGTRIATPRGELCVEDLQVGDRVITRDNGIQEIRWIGSRTLSGAEFEMLGHLRPVLIKKGALGHNLPERDMKVSPNHRMLVANEKTAFYFEEREVLVAAKHLVGLPGVEFADVNEVTYIHFMFDQHEVVLSDGTWSESFQPGDWTLDGIESAQRQEILELFPELAKPEGIAAYQSARRSLRRFEAQLLVQ